MQSPDGRRFNDQEVALIIKRAAELQQTAEVEEEPADAMTLSEIEQIAREAGIDPLLIRRAAQGLDQPASASRPSPWLGSPSRLVFERVVEGEISVESFEPLVNEIRRTFGDNGVPSVIGRTLAWTSAMTGGRRQQRARNVDVSIASRGGLTTIRVEEELRNLATSIFAPIVAGGGAGTVGMVIPAGMTFLQSIPLAAAVWALGVGGLYATARAIYGRICSTRQQQLSGLISRLETMVLDSIKGDTAQLTATSRPTLTSGEGTSGGA